MFFKARELKRVLVKIVAAEDADSEALWSEALVIINHFVRKGLRQSRAREDEIDDAQAEFLLSLMVASRRGLVTKLLSIPTMRIASYIRMASIHALVTLRQRQHNPPLHSLPNDVSRALGRNLEPDDIQRALSVIASCDSESRFVLRALILGYDMPEIIEAVGSPTSRMRLYRKRAQTIEKILAVIRDPDDLGPASQPI